MSQNPFAGFVDPVLCRRLLARLERALSGIPGGRMRFMEVCGTHTVAALTPARERRPSLRPWLSRLRHP